MASVEFRVFWPLWSLRPESLSVTAVGLQTDTVPTASTILTKPAKLTST